MSGSELAVVAPQSFQAPILIERAGSSTRKKFFEFFTVPIRNANTRAAYCRAVQQFLAWVERAGYQDLEDIEAITVAAYIETLQCQAAPATAKQHTAAIWMLFSWLTEKGVLAMNLTREVRTERFSRTEGKTPAFVDGEVQRLLDKADYQCTIRRTLSGRPGSRIFGKMTALWKQRSELPAMPALREVYETIRPLLMPPEEPARRQIGFGPQIPNSLH